MRVAYHLPSTESIYAYRTIYNGFKNAFVDLGHDFSVFTADDDLAVFLDKHQPDIFLTQTHFYYRRYLDFALLKKYRDRGMKMVTKIDFWNSPLDKKRLNEAKSMKDDQEVIRLIKEGLYGDYFYHVVEQGDPRMDGFAKTTGYPFTTIPLAADKITLKSAFSSRYSADISYIGTNLPDKRAFFKDYVFPLGKEYKLKIYGQDWTLFDKTLGMLQKFGQLYNLKALKTLQKPKLLLADEAKIYRSSKVSINVHEKFQKTYGGDCNERTFKIPLCHGFEICDNVACVKKYFVPGVEMVIGETDADWQEKILYYLKNPDKREKIIEAGYRRVIKDHTYHNRAKQIISLAKSAK